MAQYREAKTGPSGKKKLAEIAIKMAADGGHIVEHRFENNGMTYHPPKQYVFGGDEQAEMNAHLAKHAGLGAVPALDKATED